MMPVSGGRKPLQLFDGLLAVCRRSRFRREQKRRPELAREYRRTPSGSETELLQDEGRGPLSIPWLDVRIREAS